MSEIVGPTKIDCPMQCDVPDGVSLAPIPRPRHDWGDVIGCPNGEGCERWFLVADGRQK